MPRRRGFRWDGANSELEIHVDGTEVVKFTAAGGMELTGRGTVTQATSFTTGVTVSASSGTITTSDTGAPAAGAEATFVVTNTFVDTNDVVVVCNDVSTAGTPLAFVSAVGAGTFDVTVTNLHATNAVTGLVISFAVIKSGA